MDDAAHLRRSRRRYTPELKRRAVRRYEEIIEETGAPWGVFSQVAREYGVAPSSLRTWVRDAGTGRSPQRTSVDARVRHIVELERVIQDLDEASRVLKRLRRLC
ncbi:transposase [Sinosporangium siamense]|uniref:Transposase n=1 Tax=Sinosporangium siamense TaxID=1367973 RepID=A0A919VAW5_9ACTN|nr:hypothetical protein Ssi02_71620 [Sinosporangium siamense]